MVALDKKRLRREIERERRAKFKGRLRELRTLIVEARAARDAAILKVRGECREARTLLSQSCSARKSQAKTNGNEAIAALQGRLGEERQFEESMQRAERPQRLRSTARERGGESDDAVRNNLAPDMVPVFNAVRKHIKGGPRKSRTEAFLQWAEENPGEVYELMQHDADRYLAQLLAEQERTQRELKRASIAGVPF